MDTVSTVSRRLRILLAVLSGLLVMTVAGCKADASPTVAPTWDLREVPDQIDISTPDGWVRLDPDKGETADELTIAQAAPSSDNVPGINVMHYSPDIVATFVSPDTLEEDLHRYRDQSMKDWTAESTRYYSDTKTLPDRTIDGVLAAGFSGTFHSGGESFPSQVWYVWREDGMWRIFIDGFPGADEIPAELLDAIDTIHWTVP